MDESRPVRETVKNRWLCFGAQPPNGRPAVYCLPFAGGGASFYRPWVQSVPGLAIVPVQPPGREDRLFEPSFERMSELVRGAADALLPFVGKPYILFGHSMGGMMAYELVQELRRRGAAEPVHLFVSGAPAPHRAAEIPPIYHLPEPELVAEIQRRYRGLPAEVLQSRELLDLLLPRLRADLAVTGTYVWRSSPPLSCPITAFGGDSDETVSPDMIDAWREHTAAAFRSRIFSGGHFFLSEHSPAILTALQQAVACK